MQSFTVRSQALKTRLNRGEHTAETGGSLTDHSTAVCAVRTDSGVKTTTNNTSTEKNFIFPLVLEAPIDLMCRHLPVSASLIKFPGVFSTCMQHLQKSLKTSPVSDPAAYNDSISASFRAALGEGALGLLGSPGSAPPPMPVDQESAEDLSMKAMAGTGSRHGPFGPGRFDEAELMMRIKQEVQEVYPDLDFSNPDPSTGSAHHRSKGQSAASSPTASQDQYLTKRHYHSSSSPGDDMDSGFDPRGVQVKAGQMVMDPDLMDEYNAEDDGEEDLPEEYRLPEKRTRLMDDEGDDMSKDRTAVMLEDEDEDYNDARCNEDQEGKPWNASVSSFSEGNNIRRDTVDDENTMDLEDGEVRRSSLQSQENQASGEQIMSWERENRLPVEPAEKRATPGEETEAERELRAVQERLEREQAEDLQTDAELQYQSASSSRDRLHNGYRHDRPHLETGKLVPSRKDFPTPNDCSSSNMFSSLSTQFSPLNGPSADDYSVGSSHEKGCSNSSHFLGHRSPDGHQFEDKKGVEEGQNLKSKALSPDCALAHGPSNFSNVSFLGPESERLSNGIDSKGSHDEENTYSSTDNGCESVSALSKSLPKSRVPLSPMSGPFVVQLPDSEPTFPVAEHHSRAQAQSGPLDS
ncbi:hypothetical protein PoB_001527600 [Plakobranchus ocellatus]|uniref:Uncharacterized protein n=1 Tax=Plakobranchus ocellatus TaxID=259542 RepID=A0AAV3YYY3_9GAST|nr:hypothetical protein PoB_001527600 [Plakobranchus ocellatus]